MTGKNFFGETVYYIKPSKRLDMVLNERLKIEGEIIEKATLHKKVTALEGNQQAQIKLERVVRKTTKRNANSLTEKELKQLIKFLGEKDVAVNDINTMDGRELREKLISVAINYTINNGLKY